MEFIYGGITPDNENVSYKIKVNTDKPIEEVHLALKESDASGKVVEQTTVVWQNIVRSTRRPIERGQVQCLKCTDRAARIGAHQQDARAHQAAELF